MNSQQPNATLTTPKWDSLLRSALLIGGTVLTLTNKATPDQVQALGENLYGIFAAGGTALTALWGYVHHSTNVSVPKK